MRSKNEEREEEGAGGRDSERGAKTEKESEWGDIERERGGQAIS